MGDPLGHRPDRGPGRPGEDPDHAPDDAARGPGGQPGGVPDDAARRLPGDVPDQDRSGPGGQPGAHPGDEDDRRRPEQADGATATRRRGLARPGAPSPAGLLIGLLIGLLGFALAVQVRSNTSTSGLPSARQEDLVRILDDLSSREDRLRRQIASLEAARSRLSSTGDRSTAALEEARTRSTTLGILAGTVPAQGPGIQLTLTDPQRRVAAEDLLDAVEELRAAGAEALQVGGTR
ncbi:MAG TPA: DUF881 domain-containing protein, partial [Mycobacteriales bacterium]|nr:DUF881 domain-containing protein [Mycobacteriales bacterium]